MRKFETSSEYIYVLTHLKGVDSLIVNTMSCCQKWYDVLKHLNNIVFGDATHKIFDAKQIFISHLF